MKMRRVFAAVLALGLTVLSLSGCAGEKVGNQAAGKEKATLYLLTEQEWQNDAGQALSRTTYTYDDRGLVLTVDRDNPGGVEVWNEQLGIYEYQYLPCDGVVDSQAYYAYDEYGSPVSVCDGINKEVRYEYTYDENGRTTALTIIPADGIGTQTELKLEYDDAGNIKVWSSTQGTTSEPKLSAEFKCDEAGRVNQLAFNMMEGKLNYQFQYDDAGNIACVDYGWGEMEKTCGGTFTYDEAGRVVSESGGRGTASYQYEGDMLVAINDERLVMTKQDNGLLTVCYGDHVLTYQSVVLEARQADMARHRWNQFCGGFYVPHSYSNGLYGVRYPVFDLDTVLLLPKGILD